MKPDKLFCFGHRGACGYEPENTVRSVRRALELGANGVEVDVHFVDGQLVVIHDDTLDRTTKGRGRVSENSFAYLRSLDAGLGERIPTLAEIFEAVNRRAVINIELKGSRTAAPVAALIDNYIQRHGWSCDDFLISSFDHEQLRAAKHLLPEIRIGALIEKLPLDLAKLAKELRLWSVHASFDQVPPEFVKEVHQCGLKLFIYTVNNPKDIHLMLELGVDGIFSDFPELAG